MDAKEDAKDLKRLVDEILTQYWEHEVTSPDELAYRVAAAMLAIGSCFHCCDRNSAAAKAFAAYSDEAHS